MGAESLWFLCLGTLSVLALTAGMWLAARSRRWAWQGMSLALLCLVLWVWLNRHPSVAVHLIPLHWLAQVEGTGAVPFFMFIMGVLWQRSALPRQRRVTVLAMGLGVVYFLNGGLWMLQTTPRSLPGQTIPGDITWQSVDFSCVPAACATALNRLSVPTTEAEMAHLTRTRPGFGATMIRAMDGLTRKLQSTGWRVIFVQPTYEELRLYPMPALTPIQTGTTLRHLVVLDGITPEGVHITDPQVGKTFLNAADFQRVYCHQAIVFDR